MKAVLEKESISDFKKAIAIPNKPVVNFIV